MPIRVHDDSCGSENCPKTSCVSNKMQKKTNQGQKKSQKFFQFKKYA